MSLDLIPPALICRPALPMDTRRVLELAKLIWEGHDYLPYVWADWLADPVGLLAVAEYGDRLAGVGKLTRLAPGQWWLEGLRVHPDFEGRGFASHITDYLLAAWQRGLGAAQGGEVVRLTTSSERLAVHRICAKRGFVKVGEINFYAAPARQAAPHGFQPAAPADAVEMLEFALRSESMSLLGGLVDLGWRWAALCPELLADSIARRQAWWWRDRQGVLTLWEDEEDGVKRPFIQALACSFQSEADCLEDYRRLAADLGYEQAACAAPLRPGSAAALEAAGFRRDWEEILYLFEKPNPVSPRNPYGIIPPAE